MSKKTKKCDLPEIQVKHVVQTVSGVLVNLNVPGNFCDRSKQLVPEKRGPQFRSGPVKVCNANFCNEDFMEPVCGERENFPGICRKQCVFLKSVLV